MVDGVMLTNPLGHVCGEVAGNQYPSGLPHPDGTHHIQDASRKLIVARKAMGRSNTRLNDYLDRGIVPEDLMRSG